MELGVEHFLSDVISPLCALQCETSAKKRKTNDGDILNRKLSDFYPRMLISGVRGVGWEGRGGERVWVRIWGGEISRCT